MIKILTSFLSPIYQDVPTYLPSSGSVVHGPFDVKFISQDRSVEAYTETTLKIAFNEEVCAIFLSMPPT